MFDIKSNESLSIGDLNFSKEVLNQKGLVFVEFHTDWCGGCHIMAPVIKELMSQYQHLMKFCKVDFETNKKITSKYNIEKAPAIIIFKDGKIVDVIKGVIPRKVMMNKVKILLRNGQHERIW